MKFFLIKLVHGALLGLGFGMALFAVSHYTKPKAMDAVVDIYHTDLSGSIEITKHRELERDSMLIILGEIKNIGDIKNNSISVNVDLYQDGEFTKQCGKHIAGGLSAGEIRNFEMFCGGKLNDSIVDHDSYKIYITRSY